MGVPPLFELAKTRLIQNIHMLDDVGDLPYSFLAPVLRHIQNPQQLLDLEANCPQLVGETGEIWLRFIKRDIPEWEKKSYRPRDPKNWGRAYKKLKRDAEREKAAQEEQLREQMKALQQNRAGNQTQIIEGKVGYDPSARRSGFGGRSSGWGQPAAPAKTGKVAFDKLRRGMFDQKQARPKATQMPAHLLQERKGTVKQAPARMVRMNEYESQAPTRMAVSRTSTSAITGRSKEYASPDRPRIAAASSSDPPKRQRTSLPAGHNFSAPKIRTQVNSPKPTATAAPVTALKRKREEPNMFMPKKSKTGPSR